ncbi:hypothetical protein HMPREF0994_03759 [Lachnospiraceae bacterium 3_1_57FAA_CT1]|nr:hypothetical protein HMPREF0994_03759 [Lachnospiraceae bacterium 3_1_57FAA_CT1]
MAAEGDFGSCIFFLQAQTKFFVVESLDSKILYTLIPKEANTSARPNPAYSEGPKSLMHKNTDCLPAKPHFSE